MTQLISQRSGPRPALLMLALLALVVAGLFGASQLTGAKAQTGPASVTIVKQGLLGDDTATFSHDFDESGDFTLGGAGGNSITFSDLEGGTYSVTEHPLEGYVLTGAGCSLSNARSAPVANAVAGNTVGITVEPGQDLTCTFVNGATQELQYDVTVTKYVDGSLATDGAFNFTATWTPAGGSGTSADFALDSANSWAATTSPLDAGSAYAVVENGIDATCEAGDAYSLAGYTVGATPEEAAAGTAGDTASIDDLQADAYIIVWNEPCPVGTSTLTIVKEGLADGDSAIFTHDLPGQASDTFELTSAEPSITFENLPAGSYNITEADAVGYDLVSMGCAFTPLAPQAMPEGNNLVVVLGDDEDQTCTFVNELQTNEVTVTKNVDGAEATAGTFNFTQTTPAAELAVTIDAAVDPSATSGPIPFGSSYALVEDGIDSTCDEGDEYRIAGYSSGATAEEAAAGAPTETLSVESLEADLFVVVWNQDCDNIATITIVKDFNPDDSGEASFTVIGAGLEDFSIAEGDEDGRTFANLNAGDYTFTEEDMDGWMLQSIFCSGQSSPSSILINLGAETLTVTVNAGDNITCTFTNMPDEDEQPVPGTGSITLTKDWEGEEAGPDATFALSNNLGDDDDSVTLVDDGAANSVTFSDIGTATYTFDEEAMDGWEVSGINCTGIVPSSFDVDLTEGTLSIDLLDGETATCTVTNRAVSVPVEDGTITIVKAWAGGDAAPVSFTVSESLGGDAGAFTLDSDTTQVVFDELADDDYAVMESAVDGWTLTSLDCEGETTSTFTANLETGELAVVLADGEDLVCTYTNTMDDAEPVEDGTITIVKTWEGADSAAVTFTASENLGATGNTFVLDGTTDEAEFGELADGNYVVTETIPEGWTVSNIACTGHTNTVWDTDFETGVLSVNLVDGEDLTCTYANTAELTVEIPTFTFGNVPSVTDNTPNTPSENPGIVSPSAPDQPNNNPSPEQPSANIPQQPNTVSDSLAPSAANTNNDESDVAGEQQAAPLPPSAGNTFGSGAATSVLGLYLGLALLAGATGAVVYGLRQR